MKSLFDLISSYQKEGIYCALCTVVSTKGSTPLKSGAKMLLTEKGILHGTIGGGNLEKAVLKNATELMHSGETKLFEHNLVQQHGMCCGGLVQILIESIVPAEQLFIFGSGHVGRALASFAQECGFEVFMIDPRKEELEKLKQEIRNRLQFSYTEILPSLRFTSRSYIAVMTYDHQLDREVIAHCVKQPHAYLGMIGSKRKVTISKNMFRSTGLFTEEMLDHIDMPMGYDVKGKNPEEIAIGILAKIITVKNNKQLTGKIDFSDKDILIQIENNGDK